MPIVTQMSWSEIAKERHERLRTDVNWEGKVPRAAKLHVAYPGRGGFHVCDVWDSAQAFRAFIETRLTPDVQKIGVKTQPRGEIGEPHVTFTPSS